MILLKCLLGMALYACHVAATHPLVIEEHTNSTQEPSSNHFTDPNPDLVVFRGKNDTPKSNGPKKGFKTWSGKIVLPAIYDEAWDFNKWGISAVRMRKKGWQEHELLERDRKRLASYPTSYPVFHGTLGWFYINKKGKKIADAYETDNGPDYPTTEGYVRITKNGKVGLMHLSGKIIIPPKYTLLWLRSGQTPWIAGHGQQAVLIHGMAYEFGGTYGLLDSKGREISPIDFSKIALFYMGPNHEIVDVKNHQILNVEKQTSSKYAPSDEKKFIDRDNPRRLLVLYRDKSAYVLYRNAKKELAIRKEPLYDEGSGLKPELVKDSLLARDVFTHDGTA